MSRIRDLPIARLIDSLGPTLVDIGARDGLTEDLLSIAWACTGLGFEPDPAEAARLTSVGDPRWRDSQILPFAVGGTSGPATLHVPESSAGASLLRHDPAMVELFGYDNLHIDREAIPVSTFTLDDLRADGRLPRVDYMKIDIEGAELDVLRAGRSVLKDCVALRIECSFLHQRIDQPLIWDVVPFLLQEQFVAVEAQDLHRWRRRNLPAHPYRIDFEMPYSRGQLAQCDLVFLRSPEGLSVEQGLMLTVVVAALGYFDYAITVLRNDPRLAVVVMDEHGLDLERELKRWSAVAGRLEARQAVTSRLREMIPLFRSLAGRLPYVKPKRPY